MPRISVILAVYNGARFVSAAVESILDQTLGDFEFIIVDDGSTDETPDVLAAFADPRITIIRQENAGPAAAANTGLRAAQADIIARMDADDIAYPERLDREYRYMKRHPECVAVGTAVHAICPEGLRLYDRCPPTSHDEIVRAMWSGDGQAIIHPTMMARRKAMIRIGGYRRRFRAAQDLDLYLRLLPLGKVANLPEALLGYRQHPQSTSWVRPKLQVQLVNEMLEELSDLCPIPDFKPEYNGFEREPISDSVRRWGWNALNCGRPEAARRYAVAALKCRPLSMENWRLALCALRGH